MQVYNINTEKNSEILNKCETLRQYSRFVEVMRSYKEIGELTNDVIVEMLFKELTREEDLEISRLDVIAKNTGLTLSEVAEL